MRERVNVCFVFLVGLGLGLGFFSCRPRDQLTLRYITCHSNSPFNYILLMVGLLLLSNFLRNCASFAYSMSSLCESDLIAIDACHIFIALVFIALITLSYSSNLYAVNTIHHLLDLVLCGM